MENYILIGEIANKFRKLKVLASIFFRKTMGSRIYSQKEGNHAVGRSVVKRKR